MNARQRRTLEKILQCPTRSDIKWSEVESLLVALGAVKKEGRGSRVIFIHGENLLRLHKPHPQTELKRYAVENVRAFLEICLDPLGA